MQAEVIHRPPRAGETLVVGGDWVTAKAPSEETGGEYTAYEVLTSPGFGPPLHRHAWQEWFYVLEGEYEFSYVSEGELRTVVAGPGSSFTIPAGAPHAFCNGSAAPSRMLVVDSPAGTERFLRAAGVPAERPGADPRESPLDPAALGELLTRHDIEIVAEPDGRKR